MRYQVNVVRISYGHRTLEIEADSIEAAEDLALYDAGCHLYNESSSEYEIDFTVEMKA